MFWLYLFIVCFIWDLIYSIIIFPLMEYNQHNNIKQKNTNNESLKSNFCAEELDTYLKSDYYRIHGYHYNYVKNNQGLYGEYLTSLYYKEINPFVYYLLSLYIPTLDEIGSTEIDSVIITPAGLYVIEVKNRNVRWEIQGEEAYIYKPGEYRSSNKEKNPLLQNKKHIEALRNFIINSKDKELINAFDILDRRIIGYLVLVRNSESERSVINTNLDKIINRFSMHDQIGKNISDDIKFRNIQNLNERMDAMLVICNKLQIYVNNPELKEKHDYYMKTVMSSTL